jgi:NADH:ubiquinone oxidoreductase subunit E
VVKEEKVIPGRIVEIDFATSKILRRKRDNLIPILQEVQGQLGYLPREAMQEIAGFLDIPDMDVYSVVTFYNQFRLNPPGKHSIRVLGHRLSHEGRLHRPGCLEEASGHRPR